MSSTLSDDARQMLAEIQAIPDGTQVAAYAYCRVGDDVPRRTDFVVNGELYTDGNGRYVGDTPILVRAGDGWRVARGVESVKVVCYVTDDRHLSAFGVQGAIHQAAADAGMVVEPK